ncbi:hypothetical protein KIN20_000435 [Parelaphostrongylus tenuis]|uniref:Uncharacterized protein n=1 Tax=Parelaphostrongylus tenuis TaxID=148309 RepID=A0AAD5MB76_PARTN|nr:hypothetical protein KIN20_000435 [Parelaphostrongylus tenuis]
MSKCGRKYGIWNTFVDFAKTTVLCQYSHGELPIGAKTKLRKWPRKRPEVTQKRMSPEASELIRRRSQNELQTTAN